jgi:hypothetical protein
MGARPHGILNGVHCQKSGHIHADIVCKSLECRRVAPRTATLWFRETYQNRKVLGTWRRPEIVVVDTIGIEEPICIQIRMRLKAFGTRGPNGIVYRIHCQKSGHIHVDIVCKSLEAGFVAPIDIATGLREI